jgi:hypothetical protein
MKAKYIKKNNKGCCLHMSRCNLHLFTEQRIIKHSTATPPQPNPSYANTNNGGKKDEKEDAKHSYQR